MFEHRKAGKQLQAKIDELQMNLENNYKDLALQAYKAAVDFYNKLSDEDMLSQKDKRKFALILEEYDEMLKKYGHTNISDFLKERY